MSVRVDPATRRRMADLADVNWAEVIRRTLDERLEFEEQLRAPINRARALRGACGMDRLRSSLSGRGTDSTREVRKWRGLRK